MHGYFMSIKDKINRIEASLIGNRVTSLGASLLVGGFISTNLYEIKDFRNQILYGTIMCTGSAMCGITSFGISTNKIYKKTANSLKKFNKLDKRFFKAAMGTEYSRPLIGYCQLQGMYLACRDYAPKELENFYKFKKEYTKNIIPNF